MGSTPPGKNFGARGRSPKAGNNLTGDPEETHLKDLDKYVQNRFLLVCKVLEQPILQISQTNGNKYLSCQICDVSRSYT
jgi:hypothetical protein